jgi:hypothetical protein
MTAFGWYYAYDATIYLVTGFLQLQPPMDVILLNLPHVVISSIMLYFAYRKPSPLPMAATDSR